MSRRYKSTLVSATAALLTWMIIPGTGVDRLFFSLTTRAFTTSPSFVSGEGTTEKPFTLHTLRDTPADITTNLPIDIVIGDDPESVFQSSPPSPVDIAVILKNLRRMGKDSLAISIPLSWAEPDVISLAALDRQLDALPTVITSAPLSRNPVPTPIPPAFRRASIPLSSITGKTALLPLVNRIPIPDVVLGNKTSLAGFTTLESEEPSDLPYLLARWDDRAVLSFHLLAALDHLDIPHQTIIVRLGESISLGSNGPFIPIDEYGRLAISPPTTLTDENSPIRAETLIDSPDNFFAGNHLEPVLIRSDLSIEDPVAARFSESLVATVALLSQPDKTFESQHFPCPPWHAELLFIASLLSLSYGFGNYSCLHGKSPLAILAVAILALHFILVLTTSTWVPTLPALACVIAAIPFATSAKNRSSSKIPAVDGITFILGTGEITETLKREAASKNTPRNRKRR